MKIYFVRHGKTEWNLESRYQGAGGDSPLLDSSYKEMDELAHFYRDVHFNHIYASPIKRARVTAMRINQELNHRTSVSLWNRFEEFHLGKMEGMKFKEVEAKYPQDFKNFRNHPDLYNPTDIGGESYQEVIDRFIPAIKNIASNNPKDANVMIVSHGAALNASLNSLLGVALPDLKKRGGLANTSTTILETNDCGKNFQLLKWNNTEYLSRKLNKTDII